MIWASHSRWQLEERGHELTFSGGGHDDWGVDHLNRVHPTNVCCTLHVLFELKERCSMEDPGLGGDRYVNARKLAQHARSPLGKNARSPLD